MTNKQPAISIARRLEFDSEHRIPNHDGQCRHLHGHRYAIEVTLTGEVADHPGKADDGMVLDFGDIKRLTNQYVVDLWDHAFVVAKEDEGLVAFLASLPNHKTVIMEHVPTVENLANAAFAILQPVFSKAFGGRLEISSIRRYETPNCWADVHPA
ncbi:6-pyruvoyl trahydropterin synthase family protein [Polynucleobacter necessarius]|uniref:6-pyruvoyl trahydropterin synthase family protein n=1 Tax=Polynucleobacter necessarius TaxID=576610 RepID=UPI000E090E64|nr:6-carboxytetrahydropterin synthase [Polynucleobacter necessarius]